MPTWGGARERVTMMEWFDAPTPDGRSRSFALKSFDQNRRIAITMVGEKQLSWLLQRGDSECQTPTP